jgi:transposase-like protein
MPLKRSTRRPPLTVHCSHGAQQSEFRALGAQKEVAAELKLIYSALTVEEAEIRLTEFEDKWDKQYKPISQ